MFKLNDIVKIKQPVLEHHKQLGKVVYIIDNQIGIHFFGGNFIGIECFLDNNLELAELHKTHNFDLYGHLTES